MSRWFQAGPGQWMKVTRRWTLRTSQIRTGWWLAEIHDPQSRAIVECMTFQSAEAGQRWADEASAGLVVRQAADGGRRLWWHEGK